MLDSTDLALAINSVKDAVDKSAFGPLFMYPDHADFTNKQINQVAYQVFMTVLTVYLRDLADYEED